MPCLYLQAEWRSRKYSIENQACLPEGLRVSGEMTPQNSPSLFWAGPTWGSYSPEGLFGPGQVWFTPLKMPGQPPPTCPDGQADYLGVGKMAEALRAPICFPKGTFRGRKDEERPLKKGHDLWKH